MLEFRNNQRTSPPNAFEKRIVSCFSLCVASRMALMFSLYALTVARRRLCMDPLLSRQIPM
jgi:hypothetical protein